MGDVKAADYHEIAKPASPRISPDGETVAFVRTVPRDEESDEATIYTVPIDGGEPQRFTLAEGADADPRWSPEGDRLAFTSTRGADDDRQQLWVVPTGGGEAHQVTNVVGGVSSIAWSPDGERIAFVQQVSAADREEGRDMAVPDEYEPADHPDPRVIDRTVYRSMQRYFDGRRSHVYVVDADTTAGAEEPAIDRLTEGDADFGAPEWGDDETLYFTESIGEDPDDSLDLAIHAHDTATAEQERVHTTSGWTTELAATEDGRIAFTYVDPDRASLQQPEVHVFDGATSAATSLSADLDRGVGYDATPHWGPDAKTVYFTTGDEGEVAVWHAPGDASGAPRRLLRQGTISGLHVGGPRGAGPEDVVAVVSMSEWDHPGDIFAYQAGRDALTRLTELNGSYLSERTVAEPEELRFESGQGEVHGWVLTPPDFDEHVAYPLVVEVHGGPHSMWTTSGTMWLEFQTLAARGYVVFWSNPRGSAGYGREHLQASERDWGDVTLTDVLAGVETITARPYVDAETVFLTGGSFGGFMTGWAVGDTDRFTAAVAQRGVYDLTGFYGSTDGAYKLVEGDFDTVPWEEADWLWEQSPSGHAHAVETPTLIIHAEDDTRTPICTAELFHRILRKHGVETRFVRYPREGHELSRSGEPAHVVDRIERIARWFDGYSPHHDVPKALERPEGAGLSSAADEDASNDNTDP